MRLRAALDTLYLYSGYAAAACLVAIALTVVAQVGGRFVGIAVDSTESAGFCLAGATFLGLAHTFKAGDHIRVTLVTRHAGPTLGRWLELWATGACAAGACYLAYWACDLVYFSYKFGDISPGLLAVPFWIPRSALALGATILAIAFIDEFVSIARGRPPSYRAAAARDSAA